MVECYLTKLFYPNGGIDLCSYATIFSFNPTNTLNQYSIKYDNNTKIMGWSITDMSFVTSSRVISYNDPEISFIP